MKQVNIQQSVPNCIKILICQNICYAYSFSALPLLSSFSRLKIYLIQFVLTKKMVTNLFNHRFFLQNSSFFIILPQTCFSLIVLRLKKSFMLNINTRISNLIKNVSSATSHTKISLSLIMSLRIYEIYYPFSTFIG